MATRALKDVGTVQDALDERTNAPHVYQAISATMKDLAVEGIGKNNKNLQQGYKFRGIDDVYNALAGALSRHNLCMLPRVLSREGVERTTKSGGALFYTTVDVEFDLVSAVDGSSHTIRTAGEAMDSADKSTNKAMSAAYKYAAMQAFCIPTEGDNDADAHTHEVAARPTTGETPPNKRVEYQSLDGKNPPPYTCPTQLMTAARQFVHTLNGMGDLAEFIAWSKTDDVKEFVKQLKRDLPDWWVGGPSVSTDFVPLEILVSQKKRDLEQLDGLKEPA